MQKKKSVAFNLLIIAFIAFGASTIYGPPYIMWSYYVPMQEAFGLDHTQIAWISSLFGLASMPGYLIGGWIADRFNLRKLMVVNYVIVAALALVYATLPSYPIVLVIQTCLALVASLSFWAPMLKITRVLAANLQGGFFGFLEAARKLSIAVLSAICLWAFSSFGEGAGGLSAVLVTYAALSIIMCIISFFVLKDVDKQVQKQTENEKITLSKAKEVLKIPALWYVAAIIMLVYIVSTSQQYVTAYLVDVQQVSQTLSAAFFAFTQFVGPFVIIVVSFLSDKLGTVKTIVYGIVIAALILFTLAFLPVSPQLAIASFVLIVLYLCIIYSVRGLYWALVDVGKVPVALTGSAVGIISVIGYSPDFFVPQIAGRILDGYPGLQGYQIWYFVQGCCAVAAVFATLLFMRYLKKLKEENPAPKNVVPVAE